jgi:hypothetical protein
MNTKLTLFLSCLAAVALAAPAVKAAPRGGGGGHGGGHFSSMSPRGGHSFSRGGATFSRSTSGTYRNSGGRTWSGGNWSGDWRRHHRSSRDQFIFIGGFGYPYWGYPYWGWGYPYGYGYGYGSYPYGYGYGYDYDYYGGDRAYGSGYGDRSSVAQLQRRLARAGYYRGAIDGIMGPATRRGIRAYERSHGALSMR